VPNTYQLPSPTPPEGFRIIDTTSYRGCVMDGPFAKHIVPLGPGKYIGDHCLTRGIREDAKAFLDTAAVANLTKQTNYEDFRIQLEGEPITETHRTHDGGHYGIGGEMSNFYSSPGGTEFSLLPFCSLQSLNFFLLQKILFSTSTTPTSIASGGNGKTRSPRTSTR
jgi:tyrosinase